MITNELADKSTSKGCNVRLTRLMISIFLIGLFLLTQGCAASGGVGTAMHAYEIASLASHAEKAKTAISEHHKESEDCSSNK